MPSLPPAPASSGRPGDRIETVPPTGLGGFLDRSPAVALIEVSEAKGSTPREQGAWMLVSPDASFGTIGGGQLEFIAIGQARQMLAAGAPHAGEAGIDLDIPLGPQIGQCCGGRVGLSISLLGEAGKQALLHRVQSETAAQPHVLLFGGGHVGHALAAALALLPLQVRVIETRADALQGMPEGVTTLLTPVPEEAVRAAPPGAAVLVLTHDHALDFLIVGEALKRGDMAYVGMIGSKTKKATCKSWFLKEAGGSEASFAQLVCPIGGSDVKDKRPPVIAALAAAELVRVLAPNGGAR